VRALGQATTGVAPTKNHDETEPPPGIRSNHDGREALGAGFKPAPKSTLRVLRITIVQNLRGPRKYSGREFLPPSRKGAKVMGKGQKLL
jgi:hypothetical protein